jgi:hypothetical protein
MSEQIAELLGDAIGNNYETSHVYYFNIVNPPKTSGL